MSHELDITNADHIALWLETNVGDSSLGWLACRIVEAHEAATPTAQGEPLDGAGVRAAALEEALATRPGGWSWSIGEMMGLPPESRFRCFLYDHNTPDRKAAWHSCEDRATPVEAVLAAVAKARALASPTGEQK